MAKHIPCCLATLLALAAVNLRAQTPTVVDVRPGPLVVALPVPVNDRYGWLGVPDVVWSGVVGAIVALAGAALAGGFAILNQRKQLAHDGRERRRERLLTLRRESIGRLVEEIYEAPNAVIDVLSGDYERKRPSQDLPRAAARYAMVGTHEAITAVDGFVATFQALVLDAAKDAEPVRRAFGSKRSAESHWRELTDKRINRAERISMFFEAEPVNQQLVDRLTNLNDATAKMADAAHAEMLTAASDYAVAERELRARYRARLKHCTALVNSTIAALRSDIGIDREIAESQQ